MILTETTSIINYLFVFVILGLGGIITALFFILIRKEQRFEHDEEQKFQLYQHIIREGYARAEQLLSTTTTTSSTLLHGTKETNEKLVEELDHTLQLVAQHHIQSLNTAVGGFQKEYLEYLGKLKDELHQQAERTTQTAEQTINDTIEAFSKSLLGKTLGAQEIVDVKIQTMVAESEKEINSYKQVQLSKIDEEVKRLIQLTYDEVLKRSVPDEVNQTLILEALEKAKKEGVFTL